MTSNLIKVESNLTCTDMFRFHLRNSLDSTALGSMFVIFCGGLIFLIVDTIKSTASSLPLAITEAFNNNKSTRFGLIFIALVLFIFIKVYLSSKKAFKGEDVMSINYIFYEFGIDCSYKEETALSWHSIDKIEETKSYFYFHTTKNTAIIVPKKDFESIDQIEQLKDLIKSKLPKNKLSLRKKYHYLLCN